MDADQGNGPGCGLAGAALRHRGDGRVTGKPFINVACPNQTKAEAADQDLAKWAALRIHQVRTAQASRNSIAAELNNMNEARKARARYWLNHYRDPDRNKKKRAQRDHQKHESSELEGKEGEGQHDGPANPGTAGAAAQSGAGAVVAQAF
ncbi:hypothetical protein GCM10022421_08780 [Oceanisphaera sediminis]|uniref:Uncharacterized protein n=1 Tax=Oceanisphaera sediminis TaxID=981381 RepID=A0ABP7DIK4_9GAMM